MTVDDIARLTACYPRFDDGRIDYTHERVCFVVNCVVLAGDEVLLTKRGADVIAYPHTVNGVSGFIDRTDISAEEQACIELSEELAAPMHTLKRLQITGPIEQIDLKIDREWHVWIGLADFSEKFEPTINWENKTATWYKIEDAQKLKLMPGFEHTLAIALSMR